MQSSTRLITPARTLTVLSLLLVLLPVSALAAKGAAIRLPVELTEDPARIEFTGSGGYNKGRCMGAESRCDFTRIESRLDCLLESEGTVVAAAVLRDPANSALED